MTQWMMEKFKIQVGIFSWECVECEFKLFIDMKPLSAINIVQILVQVAKIHGVVGRIFYSSKPLRTANFKCN